METKRKLSFILVTVTLLFWNIGLVKADPVSFEVAQVVAEKWMERVGEQKDVIEGIVLQNDGENIGYLFNFSGRGFVVVPSDDFFRPIKAWSREGNFLGVSQAMDMQTLVKKDLRQQRLVVELPKSCSCFKC